MKKGDMILLVTVVLLIAGSFAAVNFLRPGSGGKIAVIKQGDRVIRRIDLDKVSAPETIVPGGEYEETILVEKGRIRFQEADCPDLVCVKTGWLTEQGDIAVCLPNRTMIKIEGEGSKLDGVAY